MGETDGIHAALSRIVGSFAREGANADHYATLIEEAFERAARPLPKVSELSQSASRLATAAEKLARELRLSCQLRIVDLEEERQPGGPIEAGMVEREGTGSIWPFLRIAGTLGDDSFGDDIPGALRFGGNARSSRRFHMDVGTPSALKFRVERLAEEARRVESWSKRKRPPNLIRARFEEEIKIIWEGLRGESPAYARMGTWEMPGTKFGQFLKAILDNSHFDDKERKSRWRNFRRSIHATNCSYPHGLSANCRRVTFSWATSFAQRHASSWLARRASERRSFASISRRPCRRVLTFSAGKGSAELA